ncbi:MAG: AbrB/MazE/SpoVT family DNA-binding domain-containing protein [Deferribacterales bacterium]
MIKNLTKHGNSLALVIEKPVLELLGADAKTQFKITTDGKALILTPVTDDERDKEIMEVAERITEKYSDVFRRLAE